MKTSLLLSLILPYTNVYADKNSAEKILYKMKEAFSATNGTGNIEFDRCENSTDKTVPSLYVDLFQNRLKTLPDRSGKACAAGVRKSLNVLFYGSKDKGISSGPDAKGYDLNTLNQWPKKPACFKAADDKLTSFQNYDIRVLTPKNKNEAGHIEIYFEGTWYSDFKQRISLWNNGDSKYSSKKNYRYSPNCGKASLKFPDLNYISSFLISEVYADDKPSAKNVVDENTLFPEKTIVHARSGDWSVQEKFEKQGSDYILFKKDLKTKEDVEIMRDSNSFYVLIHKIQDKKLQQSLAEDKLKNWIKEDGKAEVQKRILEFEGFTEVQKESYIKEGLKLPEHYSIFLK